MAQPQMPAVAKRPPGPMKLRRMEREAFQFRLACLSTADLFVELQKHTVAFLGGIILSADGNVHAHWAGGQTFLRSLRAKLEAQVEWHCKKSEAEQSCYSGSTGRQRRYLWTETWDETGDGKIKDILTEITARGLASYILVLDSSMALWAAGNALSAVGRAVAEDTAKAFDITCVW